MVRCFLYEHPVIFFIAFVLSICFKFCIPSFTCSDSVILRPSVFYSPCLSINSNKSTPSPRENVVRLPLTIIPRGVHGEKNSESKIDKKPFSNFVYLRERYQIFKRKSVFIAPEKRLNLSSASDAELVHSILNNTRVMHPLYDVLNILPDDRFDSVMNYLYPTLTISSSSSTTTSSSSSASRSSNSSIHSSSRYFGFKQPVYSSPLSAHDILSSNPSFPHESYNWLKSNRSYTVDNTATWGTYLIQQAIWDHQHPAQCDPKKTARIYTQPSGFGSELHETASYMSYAMVLGYVATYDPTYISMWLWRKRIYPECRSIDRQAGYLCIMEDISHCPRSVKYPLVGLWNHRNTDARHETIPEFALKILKQSPYPPSQYFGIWSAQIMAYVSRVRPFAVDILNKMLRESVVCTFPYKWDRPLDVSMHVRHGDKKSEMTLVPTEKYLFALGTLERYLKRKASVFMTSDDQSAVAEVMKLRPDLQLCYVKAADNPNARGIAFFMRCLANLKMAAECTHQIGTYHSNVCRFIEELQITVGGQSNHLFLEVGEFHWYPVTETMRPSQRIHKLWW